AGGLCRASRASQHPARGATRAAPRGAGQRVRPLHELLPAWPQVPGQSPPPSTLTLWLLSEPLLLPAGSHPAKKAQVPSGLGPPPPICPSPAGSGCGGLRASCQCSQVVPSGLQEGGVESAFHKTSPGATPAAIKKLYQVKGKKNIRATERPLSWDSFNTGDCFILDLGQNIFAWCGGKSNILERNKARDLALAIRDSERQGKAQVEIVTDGEEPAEMIQVLGPKPALKEGNPEEDLTADRTNAQAAALYKVSDATGQMNLTKVADSSPFALELLLSDDCFVLDNGLCGKIYIWKGRKANEKERQAALQVAEDFISRMRYAPNTQVEILPQGRESPIFKQFFKDWK
uniref:Gelsolin-like domain-containing protein n=1 Tax=Felis catus TaxID=9685 RepID=A0ABI7W0N8_FELCA